MDTKFVDAINAFRNTIAAACERANRKDITDGTLAQELRRIADGMDKDTEQQMKRNRNR